MCWPPNRQRYEDVYRGKAICIVVPCYNEAVRLDTGAFLTFLQENVGISVVFVDGGSSNDTLIVLEQLRGRLAAKVDVLAKKTNAGKAEAVRSGVLHALHKLGVASCAGGRGTG